MKKLTNTLYMIIAVLAIAASQTATAQIHTTSSATLAKEPTATMQNAASANVGHYGYKSAQVYTPTVGRASNAYTPVAAPARQGKVVSNNLPTAGVFTKSGETFSNRMTNSLTPVGASTIYGADSNKPLIPGGDNGEDPFAGGVTDVPVGNGTMALALLLLAYAAFIAVRKNRKEA